MNNLKNKLIQYIKTAGIVRSRELKKLHIPFYYLNLLEKEGKLQKLGRGLYADIDYQFDENQSLMEVCKRIPRGVICLLSALRFYEFTTQNPFEIWIAIDIKDRAPIIEYPPIRIVRFSKEALHTGIEFKQCQGTLLKIYNPAKTVVDCFKYRNKIGLDVALEALRDGWRNKLFTIEELNKFAKICRMEQIMSPYIQSLL
ncbi:transcriptional regulator [Opitutia bacterium SCGC AG-212-L18]|nr:transcriptional regulator [Opitutae bacterium SCGC AG-212-L18]